MGKSLAAPDGYDPQLRLVDGLAGKETPEHDWRFVITTPGGGEMTFNRYATAEYVKTVIVEFEEGKR